MDKRITVKHVQEVTRYSDAVSVECYDLLKSDRWLKKHFRAKRKNDPKTNEVFYLVSIDCADCSINDE